ncbi:aspartic proteinase nepenthesin-2-like isoform X2 [Chenopodium quinoa]|uniref:aspartic proteinase nepenthesin-2-like isoform X2 n=1 Tax=Chenopodium quinoa TaxID=63459 RepID=UPI000B771647|nr:aspartic proteinase nepenthesin-2-like isoform X2 [Chenopodium quinoa]
MMAREVSLASDGLIAPIYISLSIIVHTLENPSINVPLMARPLPVCHLVLGASNNEYAITKQLYPDEPKFSYCISSDYDTINLLIFGPKANLKGQAIKMLKNALYDFYYIDVLGIKLNGERLAVTPSVFQMSDSGTRGFIIDSGTTLTFLALDAFEALKKKVEELLGPPTKYMIFEVCYDSGTFGKWWPGKTRPIIGLEFENSLFEFEESLLWENIPNSNDLECLQIVRSDVLISFLGSQLLLDVNVGHDPNNNLLYLQKTTCPTP